MANKNPYFPFFTFSIKISISYANHWNLAKAEDFVQ